MDVYLDPAWGRHYTLQDDGTTRWLTSAEEAALSPRSARVDLFAPSSTVPREVAGGPRDGGSGAGAEPVRPGDFDALVRPAGGPPAPVAAGREPLRAGGLVLAAVVGTLGVTLGLLLGEAGADADGDRVQPVVEVPVSATGP